MTVLILGHWRWTSGAKGTNVPLLQQLMCSGCRKGEAQYVFLSVGCRQRIRLVKRYLVKLSRDCNRLNQVYLGKMAAKAVCVCVSILPF